MEVTGQLCTLATLHPGEGVTSTLWIGGWVGPRAGLDVVEKIASAPARNLDPSYPSCSLITILPG